MISHFDDFWWLGLASPRDRSTFFGDNHPASSSEHPGTICSGFFPGHPTARLCPGANEALGLEPSQPRVSEVSE